MRRWPELLEAFYADLSGHVVVFVSGLAVWDALGEEQRSQAAGTLRESVPALAVSRYEELFLRLAGDCPDFGIWANMSDHHATRAELRTGLAGLERLLESIACERAAGPAPRCAGPHLPGCSGQADRAVGGSARRAADPALGEGYIDHRIRVAEVSASSEPGRDSWWNDGTGP